MEPDLAQQNHQAPCLTVHLQEEYTRIGRGVAVTPVFWRQWTVIIPSSADHALPSVGKITCKRVVVFLFAPPFTLIPEKIHDA